MNSTRAETRVPFIIRWPGQVQAGCVDSQNVYSFVDWLPTLCAIAGVSEYPEDLGRRRYFPISGSASDRKRKKTSLLENQRRRKYTRNAVGQMETAPAT